MNGFTSMTNLEIVTATAARSPLFVGIDVGGTSIKFGVVDDLGRSLGKASVPTHEIRGPAEAFARTLAALREFLAQQGLSLPAIAAIGVGSPGPQDIPSGIIIAPNNLPHWKNFAVSQCIRVATGRPVAFARWPGLAGAHPPGHPRSLAERPSADDRSCHRECHRL